MPQSKQGRKNAGRDMYEVITALYPLCRSITGKGTQETLEQIQKHIPLTIHKVPSGTKAFDWEVPLEWNIKDAYVKDPKGKKIIDFQKSNLAVVGYSVPIRKKLRLAELKGRLHTLPEHPTWIPYVTSYYKRNWGFCLPQKDYEKLKEGTYEAVIDSQLKKGVLSYGELFLKGRSKDEVLLSTYVCHPSLCNDNLSGIALLTFLAKELKKRRLNYSYRFLFIPETIGALVWLSRNEKLLSRIKHGLVATCVGDAGKLTYKKSRTRTVLDRVAERVLQDSKKPYRILDFFPTGSDERQFSSPGFNLPIGSLMRTPYTKFPEYHTSADNLKFVAPRHLQDSFETYLNILTQLEGEYEETYVNLNPKGEPMLGKRGLYSNIGTPRGRKQEELAILWVLNLSDGTNSLTDIALRSGIKPEYIRKAAKRLVAARLLKKI